MQHSEEDITLINDLFSGNWDVFHDAILAVKGKVENLDEAYAKTFFYTLPISIQEIAMGHGLNEPDFSEFIVEHFGYYHLKS